MRNTRCVEPINGIAANCIALLTVVPLLCSHTTGEKKGGKKQAAGEGKGGKGKKKKGAGANDSLPSILPVSNSVNLHKILYVSTPKS